MSGHAWKESSWPARIAPILAFVVLVATLVIVLSFVDDLKDLVRDTQDSQVVSCQLGNDQRVADVQNLRNDITGLERDRVNLSKLALSIPSASGVDIAGWLDSKSDSIEFKRQTIEDKLASVVDPVVPGSAVRDCSLIR